MIRNSNETYILHLSDLHIVDQSTNNQGAISDALKNLISDIKKQIQNIDEMIIAISGDITDQAKFEENETAIFNFFRMLKESLGSVKILGVQIVPGNHDFIRGNSEENIKRMKNNEDVESLNLKGEDDFIIVANEICKTFGVAFRDSTYGVETILSANKKICFIRLNTCWSSAKKNEKRKLVFGKKQKRYIEESYRNEKIKHENVGKPIDLTIALAHHPLNWLEANEEEELILSMIDQSFLNVNLFLCGHVHEAQVTNYYTHNHSLMTLMTGIGWGTKKPADKKDQHRYSIYMIDITKNICDITIRKTDANFEFDYDYSIYTRQKDGDTKKLTYPICFKYPFMKLTSMDTTFEKNICIDEERLEIIRTMALIMAGFKESMLKILDRYKNFYWDILGPRSKENEIIELLNKKNIPDPENSLKKYRFRIEKFLSNYEELDEETQNFWLMFCNEYIPIQDYFLSFLKEICTAFISEFNECFPKNTKLRTHFRWFNGNNNDGNLLPDEYIMLCQSDNLEAEGFSPPGKVVKWGGLIEGAFIKNAVLLYSVNRSNNKTKTDWDDFMTLIPKFKGNKLEKRYSNKSIDGKAVLVERPTLVERPAITFGVSIKNENNLDQASYTLATLDFLGIERHISLTIDEYLKVFNPDIEKFLERREKIYIDESIAK